MTKSCRDKHGRWANPWPTWRFPSYSMLFRFLFLEKDNSNVPASKEVGNHLLIITSLLLAVGFNPSRSEASLINVLNVQASSLYRKQLLAKFNLLGNEFRTNTSLLRITGLFHLTHTLFIGLIGKPAELSEGLTSCFHTATEKRLTLY